MEKKSEWRKWQQAVLLLAVCDTSETTPKPILEPSLEGGIEGWQDCYQHLPCVPVLPLLLRLAGHPGRREQEGSLQTSGMFSHCRAPPRCPSCS